MKKLIINADDLGADETRNAGILEAVRVGVVRSVSLLPNGGAMENALRAIREDPYEGVSIGVHVNLSEGKPVSGNLRYLTGPDGSFRGKVCAQRLLLAHGDRKLEREIVQELHAQIGFLLAAGILISHLDGHQHVHIFPAVRNAAVEAAKEYRIPWMRIPEEPFPFLEEGKMPEDSRSEGKCFSDLGGETRPHIRRAGIRTTDHFRGLYMKGRLLPSLLQKYLERLPEGITELMVHPGRPSNRPVLTPFSAFATMDRQRELEALLAPPFRDALEKSGAILTSFLEEPP